MFVPPCMFFCMFMYFLSMFLYVFCDFFVPLFVCVLCVFVCVFVRCEKMCFVFATCLFGCLSLFFVKNPRIPLQEQLLVFKDQLGTQIDLSSTLWRVCCLHKGALVCFVLIMRLTKKEENGLSKRLSFVLGWGSTCFLFNDCLFPFSTCLLPRFHSIRRFS